MDYKSWHVFATENDRVCAYLRAFKDGEDTIKIGRVLTLIHGKGTGTQLMKYAINELKAKTGCRKAKEAAVQFDPETQYACSTGRSVTFTPVTP